MLIKAEITDSRKLGGLKTRKEEFEQWAKTNLPIDGKNLSFEDGEVEIKRKKHRWLVVSYGDYQDANRCARRFVAYQCGVGNITRQISWLWHPERHEWLRCEDQQFGSW